MSLFKYGAVAALGYWLGQPAGRRQLGRLQERATELWQSPKARDLKERSWDVAGERVSATTNAVMRRKRGRHADDEATTVSPAVPEQSVLDRPTPVAPDSADALQTGVLPPTADRTVR